MQIQIETHILENLYSFPTDSNFTLSYLTLDFFRQNQQTNVISNSDDIIYFDNNQNENKAKVLVYDDINQKVNEPGGKNKKVIKKEEPDVSFSEI